MKTIRSFAVAAYALVLFCALFLGSRSIVLAQEPLGGGEDVDVLMEHKNKEGKWTTFATDTL